MNNNPIQFAVVREDPQIEHRLVNDTQAKQVMLIGSGGCTALSLQSLHPELRIDLLDQNPAQLDLIKSKSRLLQEANKALFNIDNTDENGLNQCGNFESLFKCFRTYIHEFIAPYSDLKNAFRSSESINDLANEMFQNRYWPTAFELFFSDPLLVNMFGPDAIQHAAPGSYPAYFKQVMEQGLLREDAPSNYFLHHIFLGHYLDRSDALPEYLVNPPEHTRFNYFNDALPGNMDLQKYDIISLSNIFDWMQPQATSELLETLKQRMKPGSLLLIRQLNNEQDLKQNLQSHFRFLEDEESELLQKDRSLFYSNLIIAQQQKMEF